MKQQQADALEDALAGGTALPNQPRASKQSEDRSAPDLEAEHEGGDSDSDEFEQFMIGRRPSQGREIKHQPHSAANPKAGQGHGLPSAEEVSRVSTGGDQHG